jgi:TetR/AcrR family transcriptional regulator, lmrAB and yxaGH operons repressor
MTVGITRIADAKAVEPTRRDGRDRLLNGARKLLAEKGYAGMELRDVAERGKAPRGSIYHHFPGGKKQLAVEAAELEGREIRAATKSSLAEFALA